MITIQHSQFKANNVKKNKGFTLIEVLLATFIMSFTGLALLQTVGISITSSNVANSVLTDADLKRAIHSTLEPDQCERNLTPSKISSGIDVLKKFDNPTDPLDTNGVELIKSGEVFRDYLGIVKIDLEGTGINREFKVYYKRNRVRHLSTKEKKPCRGASNNQPEDLTGCYVNKCTIEYEVTSGAVTNCTILDCSNTGRPAFILPESIGCLQKQGTNFQLDCERRSISLGGKHTIAIGVWGDKLDISDESMGNVFLGGLDIGGWPTEIDSHHNVFIGNYTGKDAKIYTNSNQFFGSGAGTGVTLNKTAGSTKGDYNMFLGSDSGHHATINNSHNTFLGHRAGDYATVNGMGNVFIGTGAGNLNEVNSDNNINIGNSILIKAQKTGPHDTLDATAYDDLENDGVRINGNLKVCDSNGAFTSCKPVPKQNDIDSMRATIQALENRVQALEGP